MLDDELSDRIEEPDAELGPHIWTLYFFIWLFKSVEKGENDGNWDREFYPDNNF